MLFSIFLVAVLASDTAALWIDGKEMSMDEAIMEAGEKMGINMMEMMADKDTMRMQLDMLFKMETYMNMKDNLVPLNETNSDETKRRKKRKATRRFQSRWPNQIVPYEINADFNANERLVIMSAIDDYHTYTCLRFVQASANDINRVRFQNGAGCSSYVGMIGGAQPINLAPGCRSKGIVIHEMGHAIGFQHEQSRSDRDTFVSLMSQNIQPGVEFNFRRLSTEEVSSYGVSYDYTSVMHYSGLAFSRNGEPTIIARDAAFQNSMGNRAGFSFHDIWLANTMYNCAEENDCTERECPEGGFQGPDCECWCDSGNRNDPVKVCDDDEVTGGGGGGNLQCSDRNVNCPGWAAVGYCTGQYEEYMTINCPYSCGICDLTTTTTSTTSTTTTTTTPQPAECTDNSRYCSSWARYGECEHNPAYMLVNCKRSCDNCEAGPMVCTDFSTLCRYYKPLCMEENFRPLLSVNCRLTCGLCTSSDVTPAPTTPAPAVELGTVCADRMPGCQELQGVKELDCISNLLHIHQCVSTCGRC